MRGRRTPNVAYNRAMNLHQSPADARHEPLPDETKTNFLRLTLHYIWLRIGWIFKTESIIMPAFLDLIGGSGWLRGCLPMLNRFGQSIPPLLVSERVRNLPQKKYALAATMVLMGVCFLVLSAIWWLTEGKFAAMPFVFLTVYAVFFMLTGICQLVTNTLIGKLMVPNLRGRLAAVGSIVGGGASILCAWFLLRAWLSEEGGRFELVFGFTGIAFLIAGSLALSLVEARDTEEQKLQSSLRLLKSSLGLVRDDVNFRRLMIVAAMFGMSIVLWPHYQTLARERLEVGFRSLIPWVIAQHIGVSLFAVPLGWLADRRGNRIVLRLLLFALCVIPVLALLLSQLGSSGKTFFPIVFFLLGVAPVTFRFLANYTLEITTRENQPLYLSTLGLFISIPVMATSAIFGALIDVLGFEAVFLLILGFLIFGFWTTLKLTEPRNGAAGEFDKVTP